MWLLLVNIVVGSVCSVFFPFRVCCCCFVWRNVFFFSFSFFQHFNFLMNFFVLMVSSWFLMVFGCCRRVTFGVNFSVCLKFTFHYDILTPSHSPPRISQGMFHFLLVILPFSFGVFINKKQNQLI